MIQKIPQPDQPDLIDINPSKTIYSDHQIYVRPYHQSIDHTHLSLIIHNLYSQQWRTVLLYSFQSKLSSGIRIITMIFLYIRLTYYHNMAYSYSLIMNPYTLTILVVWLCSTMLILAYSLYKHNQYTAQSIHDLGKYSTDNTSSTLLVVGAYGTDNIIGCIGLQQIDSHTIQIKRVLIDSLYQRCGIGNKLVHVVQYYVEHNLSDDIYHLYVETTNDNVIAQKLYYSNEYKLYRTVSVAGSWYTGIYTLQLHKMLSVSTQSYTIYQSANTADQLLIRTFIPVDEAECRELFYHGMIPNIAQMRGTILFSSINLYVLAILVTLAAIIYTYVQSIHMFIIGLTVSIVITEIGVILGATYMFEQYIDTWAADDMTDIQSHYQLSQHNCFLVAVLNNDVVGCVGLQKSSTADNVCELKRMYVSNKYQRKHIATQLLSIFDMVAIQLHYNTIHLGTAYIPAMSLYEKHGFQLYDEIIMMNGTRIGLYRKLLK